MLNVKAMHHRDRQTRHAVYTHVVVYCNTNLGLVQDGKTSSILRQCLIFAHFSVFIKDEKHKNLWFN